MILVIIIFLVLAAGVVYFIMNLSSQNTTTTIIPITMRPRTTMMPTITNRTQQMMPTTIMPTTTMRPTTTLMSYMVTNIENNGGFTLNQNGRPDLFPIPKYITYVYFTTSNVGTPYAYKVYYAPTSNLNNKTVVGTYEANGQSPNISLFPLEPATDYKVSIVLINKLTNEELTNLQPVQSITITTPSISTTTMMPTTTTMRPTTTMIPTTTMKQEPGIIIYSEPEYKGRSLFLKPGIYDKNFFNTNWSNLGIGSYKNTDNSPYMIGFGFTRPVSSGGSTPITNINNWSKVIGGDYSTTIFDGIIDFNIWTPQEYKKIWCKSTGAKTYNSHWPSQ